MYEIVSFFSKEKVQDFCGMFCLDMHKHVLHTLGLHSLHHQERFINFIFHVIKLENFLFLNVSMFMFFTLLESKDFSMLSLID